MANYKIVIKPSAVKELKKLPKKDVQRITAKIETLANEPRPRGCEKLSVQEKYRVRKGNYRIVYFVEDDDLSVQIFIIGHRRDV
ncbi:MAG: type II toxin-antitoxin system RelE/ParE family toxin, partial [bacterium]